MRSGRTIPGRAGLWRSPAAPVETADADRALTELYQLHYRPLVRMAALLLPDLATAEDIVQDALAVVYSACRVTGTGRTRAPRFPCCG